MSLASRDELKPGYVRIIFHLGLFGLLCLLLEYLVRSDDALATGLKVLAAALVPFYPSIWASRIRSKSVLFALLAVLVGANLFMMYLLSRPAGR